MIKQLVLGMLASIVLALPTYSASAGDKPARPDKPFPNEIALPIGFEPEGFTIGRGHTAYSSSIPTGAIYMSDLRTGQGKILVPPQDNPNNDALALGMRVDSRSNYLFVAGGSTGKAIVYDADSGARLAVYQLGPSDGSSLVNDLTITLDAVYFTDSLRPFFYRLPLSRNGRLPDPSTVTEVPLGANFVSDPSGCCNSNGIVATENGKVLIIGNMNLATLYRVDPISGHADAISVSPKVVDFPDGLVLMNHTLYILSPFNQVQVVTLDKDLLTGQVLGTITDPRLEGPASGARFGSSLYVVNARWDEPERNIAYWITKLDIHDIQP